MSKESNSIRNKKTHSAKPYDVSQSFVAKVASRITGLNPRSLINRWLGPGEARGEATLLSNSHPCTSLSDDVSNEGPRPLKRARLPVDSPFPTNKRFAHVTTNEEISPIGPVIGNDLSVSAEPGGSFQVNRKSTFTNSAKKISTPRRSMKKVSAPATITTTAIIENVEKFNGGVDNCSESSESTSGCSSLVPQAQSSLQSRRDESRRQSLSGVGNLNNSLFPGRSSPKLDISAMSKRRPSFNTTAFNSSRLFNNSSMQSSQSSPFYSGRTMYGGASAYHSTTSGLFAPSPRRAGVTVRPVSTANSSSTPALSATAKRILDALEQFSTPVVDAKRLPVTPGSSKRKLNRYAELSVPQTSDLLRVKRRERLQDSTCAARQASISSSRPASPPPSPSSLNLQYRLGNEGKSTQSSHVGKLKYKEEMEEKTVEDVRLPAAVLPIEKLPRIDIQVPPPPPPNKTVFEIKSTQSSILSSKAPTPSDFDFKFSNPTPAQIDKDSAKLTDSSKLSSATNDKFVFSEPCKWSVKPNVTFDLTKNNVNKVMSDSGNGKGVSLNVNKVSSPNNSKETESPVGTSVVDSRTTNHKDSNSWKCSTCMVKNSEESSKCSACETSRTVTASSVPAKLVLKAPADTWLCKECYIRNKNSVSVCAACTSPKPSASKPAPVPVSVTPSPAAVTSTVANTFGDKFKLPSNKWECKECFVRNEDTAQKCVACSSVKPGAVLETKKPEAGFGSMFKKPQGSWECGACMIQNKQETNKCVACETPKPGSKQEKPAAPAGGFSFGNPITIEDGGTVTFGCPSVPKTESTTTNSTNFVFGASNSSAPSAKFTFGIPPSKSTDDGDTAPKEKKIKSPAKDTISNPLHELEKLQQKQAADTTAPFKFGATVNHSNADNKIFAPPAANCLLPETSKPNDLFAVKKDTESAAKPITTGFTFGSNSLGVNPSKSTEQPLTNFAQSSEPVKSNASAETEKLSTTSMSAPMFGAVASKPAANMFIFGSSSSTSSNEKKPPVFGSVGSTSSMSTKPPDAVEPAKSIFGASSSSSTMFMAANTEQKTPLFGSVNETKPVMGSVSSTTVPAFGVPSTTATEPVKFGQFTSTIPSTTAAPAAGGFGFGSVVSPFTAGTQQEAEKNKPSMFSLPSSNQTTGFGFGAQPAAPEPAKQSTFTFGASSAQTPAAPASSAFSFGPAAAAPAQNFSFTPKESEPARPAFAFNATPSPAPTPAVPAFGVQQPPAFGSSEPTQPAFSFGTQQPAASSTNLFGFSGSQQPAAPSPAPSSFVFGSGSSSAATPVQQPTLPTFDPNARPTFNFTAGAPAPTFTATNPSTPVSTTTRVIKKAYRRTGTLNRRNV